MLLHSKKRICNQIVNRMQSKIISIMASAAVIMLSAATASAESTSTAIASPEGESHPYFHDTEGYEDFINGLYPKSREGLYSDVVFGADGAVYVSNFLSGIASPYYIKGQLSADGKKVTFKFPQDYSEERYGRWGVLTQVYLDGDETGYTCDVVEDESEAIFSVMEDGTLSMDSEMTIGMIWSDTRGFAGQADNAITFKPFDVKAVTPPAGMETESWGLMYDVRGRRVNVGMSNDEIYVQGLSTTVPDAWVKGTVADGKATFANKQLFAAKDCFFYYFMVGENYLDEDGFTRMKLADTDVFMFDYDKDRHSLTACDPAQFILVNASLKRAYYAEAIGNPVIAMQHEGVAAKPLNPCNLDFQDFGELFVSFTLPTISADRMTLLDTSKYYYKVYVDGEPFTFTVTDYPDLAELTSDGITEVPFGTSPGTYVIGADSPEHSLYLPAGVSAVGIQGIYKAGGVTEMSDIVTVRTTGVAELAADVQVKAVKYYTIDGVEVRNPVSGIYLKQVHYSDGTVKTQKCVIGAAR